MMAGHVTVLDEDAPWTWSLRDVLGLLDTRQRRYVEMLPRIFRLKTAAGKVIPYDMQPYQAWFHAHSPLAMGKDAPDRIVEKGRGLGATLLCGMDLLMLAHTKDRVHIPVAGRQGATGDEFIEKIHDLIEDCLIPGFFDADPEVTSEVRMKGNGSDITPLPGGNPNAIRGKRAPAVAYDEYAFHPKPLAMWRAGRAVLSEGGQLTVLSTHDGAGTHYYELVEKAKKGEIAMKRFYFPVHDPAFDRRRPISVQVAEGRLRLIAPWLDVRKLDELLKEDPLGYAQENLCEVLDDALNLISRADAEAAHDADLASWERPVMPEDAQYLPVEQRDLIDELIEIGATVPERPASGWYATAPVHTGHDFASTGDLSAWTAFAGPAGEERRTTQRALLVLRGIDTPLQNALLDIWGAVLRPTSTLIDMTGSGTGFYEHAARRLRCAVHGIHFGSSIEVAIGAGDGQEQAPKHKVPIKKQLALTFARVVKERTTALLGAHEATSLQKKHLSAIRRADLDAPKRPGEGHADIFWADALAEWGSRITAPPPTAVRRAQQRTPRNFKPGDLPGVHSRRQGT
jgi:phage FluMu gp28-like protein